MNLTKLFQMQKELDEPYSHVEDRLSKDILWLQTELGELANEWRGFRYRRPESERQPRTSGDLIGWINQHGERCIDVRNPLLEEYTDCLSILLSIGNDLIHRGNALEFVSAFNDQKDITGQFNLLFSIFSDLWNYGEIEEGYGAVLFSFLKLGEMLGFTWEQIESNYIEKAKANKERNVIV